MTERFFFYHGKRIVVRTATWGRIVDAGVWSYSTDARGMSRATNAFWSDAEAREILRQAIGM